MSLANNVHILDCTLRDGGYINSFAFDDEHICDIISRLNDANIDVVECGFLDKNVSEIANSSRFQNIEILNNLLEKSSLKNSLNVAMVEYGKYDINSLPQVDEKNDSEVKGIRFSFRKSDHLNIFDDVEAIVKKGYRLFIQPIATELYSDNEIINFIGKCNNYDIEAFYIVDTHGSMLRDNFRRLYYLIDHNLKSGVKLGFHSHNNLQLSYSNAIDFVEISNTSSREIIIDSSIYGMGRGAGNLNTELLADYLNTSYSKTYEIDYLLEIVDDFLSAIKQENDWGYSLEHFLSATQNCHPNYASFLINTKNLSILEIKKLLSFIPKDERREFNKSKIENIYIEYKQKTLLEPKDLPSSFFQKDSVFIASGSSVPQNKDRLLQKIEEDKLQVITLNHINDSIKAEYLFFSNQARYNEFASKITNETLIITSNIKVKSNHNDCFVLDYKTLYEFNDLKVDNVTLLFLNLFVINKVKNVYLAGFDGYNIEHGNSYSYNEYNRVTDIDALKQMNETIANAIEKISQEIHISYLTPSYFRQFTKQKIIGVIPSRFASTRLPGKPLKDISGLPMVIHVLKRTQMSELLDEVYVATDDERIFDLVEQHGGKAIMTSVEHNNGSERMYEVSRHIVGDAYILINGDEALLNPKHIDEGIKGLLNSDAQVSLLYNDFDKFNSPSDFKVVLNRAEEIMYISRNDIPSNARYDLQNMYKAYHIMSFTKDFLDIYNTLEQTHLDKVESHELLRVLEYGYKIKGIKVDSTAISVDTPEDLEYVRSQMDNDTIYSQYKGDK